MDAHSINAKIHFAWIFWPTLNFKTYKLYQFIVLQSLCTFLFLQNSKTKSKLNWRQQALYIRSVSWIRFCVDVSVSLYKTCLSLTFFRNKLHNLSTIFLHVFLQIYQNYNFYSIITNFVGILF